MHHDLFDEITRLSARAVRSYSANAELEPAARWVADAALAGRPVPINPATVQALSVAVARFEAGEAQL
jgi:hypothetical protein